MADVEALTVTVCKNLCTSCDLSIHPGVAPERSSFQSASSDEHSTCGPMSVCCEPRRWYEIAVSLPRSLAISTTNFAQFSVIPIACIHVYAHQGRSAGHVHQLEFWLVAHTTRQLKMGDKDEA